MKIQRILLSLSLCLVLCLCVTELPADDGAHGGPGTTSDETNTDTAVDTSEAVQAPRKTERYTDKGVTIDPVAIDIAPNGDIYVAEGSRAGEAVLDNRQAPLIQTNGIEHDLRKTSVQDRLDQINMLIDKGHYPPDQFTKTSDRVRLVQDTDGDGKADTASIFADNFNDPLDGIASGVLVHDGKVYLTNIPHLWLLEDKDGDGDADKTTEGERVSLSYGWGIRWAFYGHDMHGLIKGPDGRIYFSIGDRGYNVTTKEGKHLYGPDRGAVFRMWPDGSGLELYAEGLRNPQELAFDSYGNLFTGDNNSDSGDKARFIHLLEGADYGWRQDVQSLKDRGPWNREHMWKPRPRNADGTYANDISQPAWVIPPLKNVGAGPSGLAHYPGTGDIFAANGSFLMCDYPSGVRHVLVQPQGASFKVVEDSLLPTEGTAITDVAWGYDGRLYLSDWGGGWKPNPNGYLKVMTNEAAHREQAEQIAEVKRLFAEGFEKLSDEKLIELLGHVDQRVRIHAQWELAEDMSQEARSKLMLSFLDESDWSELKKIHALWCLAMDARYRALAQKGPVDKPENVILAFGSWITLNIVRDSSETALRAQALSVLNDLGYKDETTTTLDVLHEDKPVLKYHAAVALGKTGDSEDIPALLGLLERNNNEDVAIRHAASYALALIVDRDSEQNANAAQYDLAVQDEGRNAAARLGIVLALRRLDSPLLVGYLDDEAIPVAAEAVRAIYDRRIMDAMPALAARLDTLPIELTVEPVVRRVIEANVRVADADSAERLARFAANTDAPEAWRLLALAELDGWADERNREGVWGAWWPRPEQTIEHAKAAMAAYLPAITSDPAIPVAIQARTLIQKHVKQSPPAELAQSVLNPDEPEPLRLASLEMLTDADQTLAKDTAQQLADDGSASPSLRIDARLALIKLDQEAGQLAYVQAIESGELIEKQDAIDRLGRGAAVRGAIPGGTFVELAEALKRGELDPALTLDVIEAVQNNQAMPAPVRLSVQQYVDQNQTAAEKPFLRAASIAGGSVERGEAVFRHHEGAGCMQCHRLDNEKAQGPSLSGIGAVRDLDYLYTAVVLPNADILDGYVNGVGQSDMKPMNEALSPLELRDLIAYLASLKADPAPHYQPQNLAAALGPQVAKPAAGLQHVIWLPSILLGIAASMVALLLGTILMGQLNRP